MTLSLIKRRGKTLSDNMLFSAEKSVEKYPGIRAVRRRAVSSSYYAIFHAIAALCAKTLVPKEPRGSKIYEQVYRALDHGSLKNVFNQKPPDGFSTFKEIGSIVTKLQSDRHKADYSPAGPMFDLEDCQVIFSDAWHVMDLLDDLNPKDRRTLAVILLFKNRSS